MALFRIFGPMGPFFVPLVMAYVTMTLAFLMVRDAVDGRPAAFALFAAALVAVDPLMVDYGIQPMSDVPAACWLLAAVWLQFGKGTRPHFPILAGVCAGMAFLTRPALLLAAVAIGLATVDRPLKESVRYGATLLAFVALQMWLNVMLYGNAR